MNELLGWYGYEKLDVRDRKNMNLKHLVSKKKGDSLASMTANTGRNLTTISGKHRESTINELNRDEGRLSPHNGSDSGGVGVGTTSTSATTTTANAISPSTATTTAAPITPISADSTGVCRSPPLTISTESNCENGFINKDCSEVLAFPSLPFKESLDFAIHLSSLLAKESPAK
ncbi:unnamed protein product [Medioppia subpectinata]|uniref:Uncharacterized protein n=1 Tax=Medioppia subpectinata TaxID=1979941 RepID=A0A7R9KD78_9ACAR|nr:unnamed protein product [Medioppia subpectinata]CAG2101344.1 unnamed protein product [Medioppia subpectinata]